MKQVTKHSTIQQKTIKDNTGTKMTHDQYHDQKLWTNWKGLNYLKLYIEGPFAASSFENGGLFFFASGCRILILLEDSREI